MHTGLDTSVAPGPGMAKVLLDAIKADFWVVYVGGTRNGSSGWSPALIRQYVAAGVTQFLPCWVGNQILPSQGISDVLTADAGYKHGQMAIRDVLRYGWLKGCPLGLDVEESTSASNMAGAIAYADGWNVGVREGGFEPGAYGSLEFLVELWKQTNRPTWAFPADWTRSGADPTMSPDQIVGLPDALWSGVRVLQYSNTNLMGTSVDVDVADFALAPAPGVPPTPVMSPSIPDLEAAARIAHVYTRTANVPVRLCQDRWTEIVQYVKSIAP